MSLSNISDEISPFTDTRNLLNNQLIWPFTDSQPLQNLIPTKTNGCSPETHNLLSPENFSPQSVPGNETLIGNGDIVAVSPSPEAFDSGGGSGTWWPLEETKALLRILLEIGSQFKVSNPNGRLWEIVAWKLGEMGYKRVSTECKDRFEVVCQYYMTTKGKVIEDGCNVCWLLNELDSWDNQNKEEFLVGLKGIPNFDTKETTQSKGNSSKRWGRKETKALLRIRLEIDLQLMGSCPKGDVWDAIARKLGELGYKRDSWKCKKKFETLYRHFKRTKGRYVGQNAYLYSNELEAWDNHQKEKLMPGAKLSENVTIETPDTVEALEKLVFHQTSSSECKAWMEFSGSSLVIDGGGELQCGCVSGTGLLPAETQALLWIEEDLMKDGSVDGDKLEPLRQNLVEKQLIELFGQEDNTITTEEVWNEQEIEREKREREMRHHEFDLNKPYCPESIDEPDIWEANLEKTGKR